MRGKLGDLENPLSAAFSLLKKVVSAEDFVQQLQGANIIMRLGHGAYTVVDPFVREMWLERKA